MKSLLMDTTTDGKDTKYQLTHPSSKNHTLPQTHAISWDDIQTLKHGLKIDSKLVDFYTRHKIDEYIKDVGEERCPPIYTIHESTYHETLSMDTSFTAKMTLKL